MCLFGDNMTRIWFLWLIGFAILNTGHCVSTKMDFGNHNDGIFLVTNSTKVEDEDVEVKHTIVVSTKLKNSNRRGLHARGEDEGGVLTYNVGHSKTTNDDSGEVPIVKGYKAVETTEIRTPDTRHKAQIYPDSVFVNRNIRDQYDMYPNVALTPAQWKPSNFYHNINWLQQDGRSFERRNYGPHFNNKINRKITDDAMRDFYCKKCREYSAGQEGKACIQQRNSPWVHETTTPKIKLDGKLAKLN